MNKSRITYALVLLAAYFISTAAIMSSLGIGFTEITEWCGDILLVAIFAAGMMTLKYLADTEKHKSEESGPRALAFILGFRISRYTDSDRGRYITDKKTGKRFIEKDVRRNRGIYILLALAMLALELIPFFIYADAQIFTAGIIAEAVLFVLFVFPFLPWFIYLISEFEEVSEDKNIDITPKNC